MKFNDKKLDYAYKRGYLDGQGYSDRMTGKSTKIAMRALLDVLDGDNVEVVVSNHGMVFYVATKINLLIESQNLEYFFERTHNSFTAMNGAKLRIITSTSRGIDVFYHGANDTKTYYDTI